MRMIAFLLVFAPAIGFACSCLPGAACQSVSSDGIQFVGKPTKVRAGVGGSLAVDFVVSEAFGSLNATGSLTVYTSAQSTACGYPFRLGIEYFVDANSARSNLWTGFCSQTRPAIAAVALIRQARAKRAGKRPAAPFGFIGVEPYPGVSPSSRLEVKPTAGIGVIAAGRAGVFHTATAADGSFEFTRLPESTYRLRLQLPGDLFIWWAPSNLSRTYSVGPGKMCEADFPLYTKDDPFAASQPK